MLKGVVLEVEFLDAGIGLLSVSLAFGLTVLTMAFAIGHILGCYLNSTVFVLFYNYYNTELYF